MKGSQVRATRKKLEMSQPVFAARFGLSLSTLRDWEHDRRQPSGPARVLLILIEREPDAVLQALAPRR